jgi:hypothetical protein
MEEVLKAISSLQWSALGQKQTHTHTTKKNKKQKKKGGELSM